MTLSEAIEILACGRQSRYRFEREFAVAMFAGWLNSPAEPNDGICTLFAALSRAVLHSRMHSYEPPSEWLSAIFDATSYVDKEFVIGSAPLCFEIGEHIVYNNCQYVADITRFVLTYRPKSLDKRKAASLGKAWEFINKHGGFTRGNFDNGRTEFCSISTHQLIWRKFKRSAALQCARFHGTKFDWYIDPRRLDFLELLTETAKRRDSIIKYFAEALDVQSRLMLSIDKRSMRDDDFHTFPSSLQASKCKLTPITASMYVKMDNYRRSSVLSEPEWN